MLIQMPQIAKSRAPFTGVRHAARLIFVLLAGLAQVREGEPERQGGTDQAREVHGRQQPGQP